MKFSFNNLIKKSGLKKKDRKKDICFFFQIQIQIIFIKEGNLIRNKNKETQLCILPPSLRTNQCKEKRRLSVVPARSIYIDVTHRKLRSLVDIILE